MHILIFIPFIIFLAILHFAVLGTTKIFKLKNEEKQTWSHLVSLDYYANTLLGGSPNETISSRLGKNKLDGCIFCGIVCRILDFFEKDHCTISIKKEEDH